MDSTLRMLIDATAHLNASSAEERLSGIQAVVEAVNRMKSLSPEDQVEALTQAHFNVEELRRRVEAATAEYDEARIWLKVLEGVVRPDDGVPEPAAPPPRSVDVSTAVGEQAARAAATVLAELHDTKPAAP